MAHPTDTLAEDFDFSPKIFNELMAQKVTDILVFSSPYEAFIPEEEGRLAERVIKEYKGLNLSRPPRLTWVSTADEAFALLAEKKFDFVITTPRVDGLKPHTFAHQVKEKYPDLPIYLLTHNYADMAVDQEGEAPRPYDRVLFWDGNAELLLAQVKNLEDSWNIARDTELARVRVIIMVEDSPYHYSSVLPLLYKEIVIQTQAVMEDTLNDQDRLLRMRARPKVLTAVSYEEALGLYQRYKPYLLGVLSDARFPKDGKLYPEAGFELLSLIKENSPDVPLLMFSSGEENRIKAESVPAIFVNKSSPVLHSQIRSFFIEQLGFGDFVFRMPDGREVGRVSNLKGMEEILATVPEESLIYHARHNHYSIWLMARSEIVLATKLRLYNLNDFSTISNARAFLVACFQERRRGRQRGIVTDFTFTDYRPGIDFIKIGRGSLGGKARGLAFLSMVLEEADHLREKFPDVNITIPETIVITTDGFNAFMAENHLHGSIARGLSDEAVCKIFLDKRFPDSLYHDLEKILKHNTFPLAVRSSSLLEDGYFKPFAGIYRTYMIPNNDPSLSRRVNQLVQAIKCVYASTFLKDSRSFARNNRYRTEEEKMAVVIQQLVGKRYGNYYLPAISGVAKSFNFYPVAPMTAEDGIAYIALGLGKTVVEGMDVLRFCPRYPELLPQFSTVDDILKKAQRYAYALDLNKLSDDFAKTDDSTLIRLAIDDMADHPAVRYLASTYHLQDHRIRDSWHPGGCPVMTFARILKHRDFPLAAILSELLAMGQKGMGEHVEIEFCVNLSSDPKIKSDFSLLQLRPLTTRWQRDGVRIDQKKIDRATIYTHEALGDSRLDAISDIIYVKPEDFDPARTVEMAAEIGHLNGKLEDAGRKYMLIGPGRWGSADHWLGIPVTWQHIAGVNSIVEASVKNLKADPSQGSHFFHNITSLGIGYLTVRPEKGDVINWQWLSRLPVVEETRHIRHVSLAPPAVLMIDGRTTQAVLLSPETVAVK